MARYVVGIDLGTTNSALAYAEAGGEGGDSAPASPSIRALPIPQVVGVNDVADRPVLPSFLYLPAAKEFAPGAVKLPWSDDAGRVVGSFARDHGAKVPGRLVGSAKSWLSHAGVDRKSPILPWGAADDVARVSPVEASTAYLAHLRDAWNQKMAAKPADRLERQDVLLTVPASFDAVARDLTVEAARGRRAGARHPLGGAAGRVLRLARRSGGRLAEAGQGGRPPAGLRRRRRDDRFLADRRDRSRGRTSR